MERREAVKILAERHGITRVDEGYEDGETLLSRKAGLCAETYRVWLPPRLTPWAGKSWR